MRRLTAPLVLLAVLALWPSMALAQEAPLRVIGLVWDRPDPHEDGFLAALAEAGLAIDWQVHSVARSVEVAEEWAVDLWHHDPDLIYVRGARILRPIASRLDAVISGAARGRSARVLSYPVVYTAPAFPRSDRVDLAELPVRALPFLAGATHGVAPGLQVRLMRAYGPLRRLAILAPEGVPTPSGLTTILDGMVARGALQVQRWDLPPAPDRDLDDSLRLAALFRGIDGWRPDFLYLAANDGDPARWDRAARLARAFEMPTFAAEPPFGSALLTARSDPATVGRLAGRLAARILTEPIVPEDLPIGRVVRPSIQLNAAAIDETGRPPPPSLLRDGVVVHEAPR